MKKIALVLTRAASLCALSACSHYTEATTVKHVAIAPGTSITTSSGGCINSAGGTCEQQGVTTAQ